MKNLFLLIGLVCTLGLSAQVQNVYSNLPVFLDCQTRCDRQFLRIEMPYVNFMRDRQEADVFMQLIDQNSGNGGTQYSLFITDLKSDQSAVDTLVFFTNPEDSDNVKRTAILKNIKNGLLPYLIQSDWKRNISFDIEVPENEITTIKEVDPWNDWVFRIGGNFSVNGEDSFNSFRLQGRTSASRVTIDNKFSVSARLSRNTSEFTLSDGEEIRAENNSAFVNLFYVKSISQHWSAGGFAEFSNSDFSNIDRNWSIKPAIEYSYFPYDEATTRELTALYRIGLVHNVYQDSTILNKLEEDILQQNLRISYEIIKDWGTLELRVEFNNYPRNWEQLSIEFGPELEWNIFRGFSLDLFANVSYIADRINVVKEAVSDQDILLGNRQLNSSFSYFSWFGINYRFGSKTNNVVNPRF